MKWQKRGNATTLEQYVQEKTGKTFEEFVWVNRQYNIKNLDVVAGILTEAAKTGRHVTIVGDYDADGIGSLAIFTMLCSVMGIRYSLIIPKRISEGYGLSDKIIKRIPDNEILITVDNGITATEQIKEAKRRGMLTIIMDHHIAGDEIPDADVIIDPAAFPGTADFSYYCGAGLAFKLAEYLLGNHPIIRTMSAYAALSTIGDSVPLIEDNRRIVIQGMAEIHVGANIPKGLKKLMELCNINEYSTAEDLAFCLVPCINAPGRLIDDGSKLAMTTILSNGDKSDELAEQLISLNKERKDIVTGILESVDIESMKTDGSNIIIYYNETLQEGLVGLLAGRFSEETGKPAFVLCKTQEGLIKSSGRAKDNTINLKEILDACSDLFIKYGGHKKAAAFSLKEENLNAFVEKIKTLVPAFVPDDNRYYDFEIQAKDLISLSDKMDETAPFGEGIPCPVVAIKNIRLGNKYGNKISMLGDKEQHIKLHFLCFNAIGFNMGDRKNEIEDAEFVDLLGRVEKNHYNGKTYYQLRLEDFKPSERNSRK